MRRVKLVITSLYLDKLKYIMSKICEKNLDFEITIKPSFFPNHIDMYIDILCDDKNGYILVKDLVENHGAEIKECTKIDDHANKIVDEFPIIP